MSSGPGETDSQRAEHHAGEAERLLRSRLISSHVKAQAHATLALYYAGRRRDGEQQLGATRTAA
ncbi:MAG TPA: hypothetical protein VEH79_02330 [Gaiellaceae bacterium]|nr:hypothetical protein [Gaiellaceae bacterium]